MTNPQHIVETWDHLMPGDAQLAEGLAQAIGPDLTIVSRRPSLYTSTFPSETVVCRNAAGRTIHLFCKYGVDIWEDRRPAEGRYGRHGVEYELAVYRTVLEGCGLPHARLAGGYTDPSTGHAWMIVEHIDAWPMTQLEDARLVPVAAFWIGEFHGFSANLLPRLPESLLMKYDSEHYLGYARRAWQFAPEQDRRQEWFSDACAAFDRLHGELLAEPLTVIHGEYCPNNILYGNRVYPVDWESAAIGAGEIDLAALTDGNWPADVVEECEAQYHRARWRPGPPPGFRRKLALARMFWAFRWLGEAEAAIRDRSPWHLDSLRRAFEQLQSF